jgi:hypothetical protein
MNSLSQGVTAANSARFTGWRVSCGPLRCECVRCPNPGEHIGLGDPLPPLPRVRACFAPILEPPGSTGGLRICGSRWRSRISMLVSDGLSVFHSVKQRRKRDVGVASYSGRRVEGEVFSMPGIKTPTATDIVGILIALVLASALLGAAVYTQVSRRATPSAVAQV